MLHFLIGRSVVTSIRSVLYIILVQILYCGIISGQTIPYTTRKDIIDKQLANFSALHDSILNNKKDLINGKVYYPGGNNFVHPFYGDNSWKPATIYSGDAVYKSDLVKYDINLDYIVLLHRTDSVSYPIYLNREFVKEFIIYGQTFKYLGENDITDDILAAGYYEIDDYGKTRLLIHRKKLKIFDSSSLSETYSEREYFYINMNGKYLKLEKKNCLIKILNDHKREIKAFMKNNNLRFSRGDFEQAGKVLEYYETL